MADADEARLYQPGEVDEARCQALMWNHGRGKLQCSRAPLKGRELCRRCDSLQAKYGRVRGPIPAKILGRFRQKALKGGGESKQWYARHLMWACASELVPELEDLNELDEDGRYRLTDELYERCLAKIQVYIQKEKNRGGGSKYERGAGVRTRDDRQGGGRYGTERERYNGKNGGRVFKWYTRTLFNKKLARMGVGEESCTERQCMLALAATSEELRKYPIVTEHLTPYLGPQCYPHLDRSSANYRVRGTEEKIMKEQEGPDRAKDGEAGQQERGGVGWDVQNRWRWLRCNRIGCGKWRCVDPSCVPAL